LAAAGWVWFAAVVLAELAELAPELVVTGVADALTLELLIDAEEETAGEAVAAARA
jgi:hypothetical protein